ncbi:MAG: hypothetical protein M1828_001157 [Chrysothrix sp. TS-e1954]|nr:MAG: hypothetical protein M1828_001157 [Chrysothrix sp. TS-e1954]
MAPRVSRASIQNRGGSVSAVKPSQKRKQRGLNAFSIASKIDPGHTKVKQHRLGEAEGDEPYRKRRRLLDDEEDESESHSSNARRKQEKVVRKGEEDDLDASGGSDSEGNEWRMGVDEGDDTDVDSDEAFAESDEERYEGFAFRGSASKKTRTQRTDKTKTFPSHSVNLDENESVSGDDHEASDDSLGSDAVDLATMLDDDHSSIPDEPNISHHDSNFKQQSAETDDRPDANVDEEFEGFDEDVDDSKQTSASPKFSKDRSAIEEYEAQESESDSSDGDEDNASDDVDAAARLQKAVDTLPRGQEDRSKTDENRSMDLNKPTSSDFLAAMKGLQGIDPALARSMKNIVRTADQFRDESSSIAKVPLPKRQQDRLDRAAAYDKAKQTLDRWIDTVKHRRRAEHLQFPLVDSQSVHGRGSTRLLPLQTHKSQDNLDTAVDDILLQSGLGGNDNTGQTDQAMEGDDLKPQVVSYEEVVTRRNELRRARDLLFREERRARHINKIKSKAYRRVHRKERERAAEKEKNLLTAAGVELSDEEREKNDRRRAMERMGGRHKKSQWAKSMKSSGRAIWDDEARSGMIDMARRDEELRQRVEGKTVRPDDEDSDGITRQTSSNSGDSDGGDEDDELERSLFKLREEDDQADHDASKSRLGSMAFMQRADERQRRLNEETINDIRRDVNGEIDVDESDSEGIVGRQSFGPKAETTKNAATRETHNELEEKDTSTDDEQQGQTRNGIVPTEDGMGDVREIKHNIKDKPQRPRRPLPTEPSIRSKLHGNAQIVGSAAKSDVESQSGKLMQDKLMAKENKPSQALIPGKTSSSETVPPPASNGRQVTLNVDDSAVEAEEPFVIPSNEELVRAAFGGDDVEEDFDQEKRAAAHSEDEKTIDTALPGWGSWTGDGVSRRQQNRNKGKFVIREAGIKPSQRKDARLERVILSEKRIKKNTKYLASSLPHPYETKQQYERSLRIPIGPEWTTKESFQNATKPRVIVKQGIIRPMEKPLL